MDPFASDEAPSVPETITCVDCGGTCHRLHAGTGIAGAGTVVIAYRCVDCLDRWDLVFDEHELDDVAGGWS